MEVNRVWMKRHHWLFCEQLALWYAEFGTYSLFWQCVFVLVRWSVSQCLLTRWSTDTKPHISWCASLINKKLRISFFLSHCLRQTNRIYPSAFISTYQHKLAHENMLFTAAATCTDSQPLTTYTPSVMFYKHILNNSAHPHLSNGLFFPEGAWLLFASSRLSFSSCLSLFLCLLSPLPFAVRLLCFILFDRYFGQFESSFYTCTKSFFFLPYSISLMINTLNVFAFESQDSGKARSNLTCLQDMMTDQERAGENYLRQVYKCVCDRESSMRSIIPIGYP